MLAVLALTRRPLPRDTLLGLFWAEHDEGRARHSLSNALSSLRGALGELTVFPLAEELDEILDRRHLLGRKALDLADQRFRSDLALAHGSHLTALLDPLPRNHSPGAH